MARDTLVSVLTPSYNQGRYLGDCIAAVARQTYRPIEHVIVDGGSTDETLTILHTAPSHVRWVSESDNGQSEALNKAFAMSEGDIVGWLNSDDAYFSTQVVECAVNFFAENPEVDVLYGHAVLVNADGLILHMIWVPPFSYKLLRVHNFVIQPTVFLRREALGPTFVDGTFDYSMDTELWFRLAAEKRRFARIGKVLAIDRHHDQRKALTSADIAEADFERLVVMYGLPSKSVASMARKALKIVFRLLGAKLVSQTRERLAFEAMRDGKSRLLVRQLAVRRAAMPKASPNIRNAQRS